LLEFCRRVLKFYQCFNEVGEAVCDPDRVKGDHRAKAMESLNLFLTAVYIAKCKTPWLDYLREHECQLRRIDHAQTTEGDGY